ncbi:MAG TPA: twin-arginine translocase subunit TatC [Candidatus Limnocylindria bacterium]|nr:twin-arginine translocase subunit TatC [Candidatus Limnocylindria bacterium]
MTLTEHLRELRHRMFVSAIAVVVGAVVGWIYYDEVFAFLRHPADVAVAELQEQGQNVTISVVGGVGSAFSLQLKLSAYVGLILASPVWLYQLWRFVTPGLHRNERRWAFGFLAAALPLFLFGIAFAYWALPKGLGVLLGFTPDQTNNLVPLDNYLTFVLRMCLFFGLGFLLPLLLVLLNAAGLISGQAMWSHWREVVLGTWVFAAVATPTGDIFNLSLLAVPIMTLIFVAMGIASLNDRRRRRRGADADQWDDDETSPLDTTPTDLTESAD